MSSSNTTTPFGAGAPLAPREVSEHPKAEKEAKKPIQSPKEMPIGVKIEPLKLEFKRDGMTYRQLRLGKTAAIYAVLGGSGKLRGHEVIIPSIAEPFMPKPGVSYPWRYVYPSAKDGGESLFYIGPADQSGWSLQRAELLYTLLEQGKTVADARETISNMK